MTIEEVARLCRAVTALVPSQRMDEDTPAMWLTVLAPHRFVDARQAVINLGGRQQWIAPSDIVAEIKAIRRKRLDGVDRLAHLASTPDEWRQLIRRVADGDVEVPAISAATNDPELPAPAEILAMIRSLADHKTLSVTAGPPPAAATVSAADSNAMEAERARQLAALAALDENTE